MSVFVPYEERVRRYPVPFVLDGSESVVIQPLSEVLVPLRLIVSEPSRDAEVELEYGNARFEMGGWNDRPGQVGHSRLLVTARAVAWHPGTRATLRVRAGTIGGACMMCEPVSKGIGS